MSLSDVIINSYSQVRVNSFITSDNPMWTFGSSNNLDSKLKGRKIFFHRIQLGKKELFCEF